MKKILLASQSPRRKELLSVLGFDFETVSIDCEENFDENMPAENVAEYLSLKKSKAYGDLDKNTILITADTVVTIKGEIMGKPADKNEAQKMLKKLSNDKSEVYTGITVRTAEKTISKCDVAHVYFNPMDDEEINFYIDRYQPFDKAGSYGVQEWIGMAKISKIEGSFYTIMGLPTAILYEILKELNSSN